MHSEDVRGGGGLEENNEHYCSSLLNPQEEGEAGISQSDSKRCIAPQS